MIRIFFALALLACLTIASESKAQYVSLYAPPPVVAPAPVFTPPVQYHYSHSYATYPAPVVVRRPAYVAPTIPVAPRPRYRFYTPYGGSEVRVPGRPVANTLRAIIR